MHKLFIVANKNVKEPVYETKYQSSYKIGSRLHNGNTHIREMYTIHHLHGQPKDDGINNQGKNPNRYNKERK